MKLFTEAHSNPKTAKGIAKGFLTAILHLAHAKTSGYNVCKWASALCMKDCLDHKGRGAMKPTKTARVRRTRFYFEDRQGFMAQLEKEIVKHIAKASRKGLTPCFRLNGTSDLPDLAIEMAWKFPTVQFYDYTKSLETLLRDDLPSNYHLTFSRSETNETECKIALANGFNVAVIFEDLPETLWGYPVIDGDETDLRFLDRQGVIVGLTPKGLVNEGFQI